MTYYLLMKDQNVGWHIVDMDTDLNSLVRMGMKLLERDKQIQIITRKVLFQKKILPGEIEELNMYSVFDYFEKEIRIFPTKREMCEYLAENFMDENARAFSPEEFMEMDFQELYQLMRDVNDLEIEGIGWGEPFCV